MRHGAAYDGGGGVYPAPPGGGPLGGGPPGGNEPSCLEQLLCALCTPICKEVGIDLQQMQAQNNQESVHLTQPQPQTGMVLCMREFRVFITKFQFLLQLIYSDLRHRPCAGIKWHWIDIHFSTGSYCPFCYFCRLKYHKWTDFNGTWYANARYLDLKSSLDGESAIKRLLKSTTRLPADWFWKEYSPW